MNREKLDALIAENYISARKHPELDLWIYNYTPKCQYEANWNDITIRCRGLIMDENSNIVANPFPKFFNLGEQGITIDTLPQELPQITEKLDGSLGISYRYNDSQIGIATRGSFSSEMAIWATEWMQEKGFSVADFKENHTYLFEILYHENKIVVDYDREELVLLAVRNIKTGEELNHFEEAERLGITPVKQFNFTLSEAIERLQSLRGTEQEGFVVKYSNGLRIKLKCEDYVKIHRALSSFSKKHVIEAMVENRIENFISALPDEIFNEAKEIIHETEEQKDEIINSARETVNKVKEIATRKEQAQVILQSKYPKVAFALLDNRDTNAERIALNIILKNI